VFPTEEHWRLEVFMEPARQFATELFSDGRPPYLFKLPCRTTRRRFLRGPQGVLLDEWRGFHPHTTWSTVTLHHALAMVEESAAEEICTLGITRAYMTRSRPQGHYRHGAVNWIRSFYDPWKSDERLAREDTQTAGWTWYFLR